MEKKMDKKFLGMTMDKKNILKILKRVELLVNILSGIKMEKKRYLDIMVNLLEGQASGKLGTRINKYKLKDILILMVKKRELGFFLKKTDRLILNESMKRELSKILYASLKMEKKERVVYFILKVN